MVALGRLAMRKPRVNAKAKKARGAMKAMKVKTSSPSEDALVGAKKRPAAAPGVRAPTCWDKARTGMEYEKALTTAYSDDGEENKDEGKITRAMRYTFQSFFGELVSAEDKKIWKDLKQSSKAGKRSQQDSMILKYVPHTNDYKSKFKPDAIHAVKKTQRNDWNRDEYREQGQSRNIMLHSLFKGDRSAMQTCEMEGDIWEDNGMMYVKTCARVHRVDTGTKIQGTVKFLPGTAKEMAAILCEMEGEMPEQAEMADMFKVAKKVLPGRQASKRPTDCDLTMLQDRWKADTCGKTLHIRDCTRKAIGLRTPIALRLHPRLCNV